MRDELVQGLDRLEKGDFDRRMGEAFRLRSEEGGLELALAVIETRSLLESVPVEPGERHPFSVIFQGPAEPVLPQQTYELEHPEMGALALFVVPLGPDRKGGGVRYEAVFT